MTSPARAERDALCDLFLAVGPDAPTLCEGWATRDLAAHLAVRERRPDAAVGIVVPPFAGYGERVRTGAARGDWTALVDRVRSGPPVWMPTRLESVDRLANTIEFFVHHEDVRRAQPGWQPRDLDAALEHELWDRLRRMARLLVRRWPAGLVLAAPGDRRIVARKGSPEVTVHGPVGELVLFVYGRQRHARVEIVAPDDLAEQLRTARFGL